MRAPYFCCRAVVCLAPLFSLLLSTVDLAAQGAGEHAAPTERARVAPPARATAAEPDEPLSLGPVERLPSSAYPEWQVRGIQGGSLSGTFHGMPFPYYPKTGIGVSGYAWLDTGYETINRGNDTEPDIKYLLSQGRAVLRVTPTYSLNTFFVQAQVEFVANKDQSIAQPNVADIDDLWIRAGQWKQWDVQVGRFEAFEVYHFGMGLDLNTLERLGATDQIRTPPDVYGLTTLSYRQSGVGNVAFHIYPTPFLRFEALGQFGFDTTSAIDTVSGRAAGVLDFGWLKVKAEGDARKQFPALSTSKESRVQRGGSGAVQFVLAPLIEFGGSVAYGLVDHYNTLNTMDPNADRGDFDTAGSVTDTSYGGFANMRVIEDLVVGGGLHFTNEDDQQQGNFTHLQGFGAVQYAIGKQLLLKVVGAYAKAHIGRGLMGVEPWDNTMLSGRVRLTVGF